MIKRLSPLEGGEAVKFNFLGMKTVVDMSSVFLQCILAHFTSESTDSEAGVVATDYQKVWHLLFGRIESGVFFFDYN